MTKQTMTPKTNASFAVVMLGASIALWGCITADTEEGAVERRELPLGRETVVVDLSIDQGTPSYVGSGFLHGMTATEPAAAVVNPLKPNPTCFQTCSLGTSSRRPRD